LRGSAGFSPASQSRTSVQDARTEVRQPEYAPLGRPVNEREKKQSEVGRIYETVADWILKALQRELAWVSEQPRRGIILESSISNYSAF
jgi:hypothetical protein